MDEKIEIAPPIIQVCAPLPLVWWCKICLKCLNAGTWICWAFSSPWLALWFISELCCNHLKALNWMLHSRSVFIASYLVVQSKCCSFCEFSSKQEAAPSLARRTAPLCPRLSFVANIRDILHKQHIQTSKLFYHNKPSKYVIHIIMPRIQIVLITW